MREDNDKNFRFLHARPGAVLALVCALFSLPPASTAAPDAARRAWLDNLLAQDCGSCHGLTRKGGLGPPLLPGNLAGKSDALLVKTILQGRPGTPMPPWNTELSADDARYLVRQLRRGPMR